MTFKVEFTPEAEADLNRLFDFLLDRAETVEEAMRAYEAVELIRTVAVKESVQNRGRPDSGFWALIDR